MEQVHGQELIFLIFFYFLPHSYAFFTPLDLGAAPWFKVVLSAGELLRGYDFLLKGEINL